MFIAVACENGQVFQHFGRTPEFAIFEVEDGVVKDKRVVPTGGTGHGALAGFLREYSVDLLICGGIGGGAQQALSDEGIKLVAGAEGAVDGVLAGYLNGTLAFKTDFTCDHHHHEEDVGEEHACGGSGSGHTCGGCRH